MIVVKCWLCKFPTVLFVSELGEGSGGPDRSVEDHLASERATIQAPAVPAAPRLAAGHPAIRETSHLSLRYTNK